MEVDWNPVSEKLRVFEHEYWFEKVNEISIFTYHLTYLQWLTMYASFSWELITVGKAEYQLLEKWSIGLFSVSTWKTTPYFLQFSVSYAIIDQHMDIKCTNSPPGMCIPLRKFEFCFCQKILLRVTYCIHEYIFLKGCR